MRRLTDQPVFSRRGEPPVSADDVVLPQLKPTADGRDPWHVDWGSRLVVIDGVVPRHEDGRGLQFFIDDTGAPIETLDGTRVHRDAEGYLVALDPHPEFDPTWTT